MRRHAGAFGALAAVALGACLYPPAYEVDGAGGAGGTTTSSGSGGKTASACRSTADCAGGELCTVIDAVNHRIVCGDAFDGGVATGWPCSTSDACASGLCLATSQSCSLFCAADDECGDGNVCAEDYVNPGFSSASPLQTCRHACENDLACDPFSALCTILLDDGANRIVTACDVLQNTGPFGALCGTTHAQCRSNTCIYDASAALRCSRPCATAADCATPFPNCGPLGFTNPDGVGSTQIRVCIP